jgi:hypothetical protein
MSQQKNFSCHVLEWLRKDVHFYLKHKKQDTYCRNKAVLAKGDIFKFSKVKTKLSLQCLLTFIFATRGVCVQREINLESIRLFILFIGGKICGC